MYRKKHYISKRKKRLIFKFLIVGIVGLLLILEFVIFPPLSAQIKHGTIIYPQLIQEKIDGFNRETAIIQKDRQDRICPQIDVPISNVGGYLKISSTQYNGWHIYGSGDCRKGKYEGENINYYYCGGVRYFLGVGTIQSYVAKTEISKDGTIGKTYKYIILNVYDENKRYTSTQCLGNPDDFEREQAEKLVEYWDI